MNERSPYKFLDSYGPDDRDIFFGREREIRILLSDIVVTRLVVLFAKTGTGKTSLVNAGVRPLLEERGYRTFLIRVAENPIASARSALVRRDLGPLLDAPLGAQLSDLSARLGQPTSSSSIQFQEFFLRTVVENPDDASEFISTIADLYDDEDFRGFTSCSRCGKKFFVHMDLFRDEIPTIFQNDSNLRLRWFNKEAHGTRSSSPRLPAVSKSNPNSSNVWLIADLSRRSGRAGPASDRSRQHSGAESGTRTSAVSDARPPVIVYDHYLALAAGQEAERRGAILSRRLEDILSGSNATTPELLTACYRCFARRATRSTRATSMRSPLAGSAATARPEAR